MSVVVTGRQPERKRKEKESPEKSHQSQGTLMTLFSQKKKRYFSEGSGTLFMLNRAEKQCETYFLSINF